MKFLPIKAIFLLSLIFIFPPLLIAEDDMEIIEELFGPEEKELSGSVEIPEGLEIPEDMVYIPDGYSIIGNNDSFAKEEKPAHHVYLKGFLIDKYEVSNEKYEKFLQATGHTVPKYWYDDNFNQPDQPVVGVSWKDAVAYSKWANKRLPTEAEWEKAARGTKDFIWPWGNDWERRYLRKYLNIFGKADNYEYTSPVHLYIFGISPYRAFNMAGNVWEWCQDWYDPQYYKYSSEINPLGPRKGIYKVLRGGSWANKIYNISTTKRIRNFPTAKSNMYGFRSAKSIY